MFLGSCCYENYNSQMELVSPSYAPVCFDIVSMGLLMSAWMVVSCTSSTNVGSEFFIAIYGAAFFLIFFISY